MSTPDYVLNKDWSMPGGSNVMDSDKTLPAGAFVRPIDKKWVPKHVIDFWNIPKIRNDIIFCYTRLGIVPIEEKYLVKV